MQVTLSGLFAVTAPLPAIVIPSVTTGSIPGADYNSADYLAPYGTVLKNPSQNGISLDGVVWINFGGAICSGALIGATQVLTAAHCAAAQTGTVYFINSSNTSTSITGSIVVDPDYKGDYSKGSDLAIINLDSPAPPFATVYQLFNGTYTMGSTIAVAGFGYTGTGDTGETTLDLLRRVGENAYDADGTFIGVSSNLMLADFDNGNSAQHILPGTSYGLTDEVDIGHGDSGGPSFYMGQIIGVHDIIDCQSATPTSPCLSPPSVNPSAQPNSYYGEIFGDTSVAANMAWLDAQMAPEPSSWILFLCGAAVIGLCRYPLRRRTCSGKSA